MIMTHALYLLMYFKLHVNGLIHACYFTILNKRSIKLERLTLTVNVEWLLEHFPDMQEKVCVQQHNSCCCC